jgi:NitT/TauT family transport system ATP-binding protein
MDHRMTEVAIERPASATPERTGTALSFRGVSKSYADGTHAVEGVDFELAHGQLAAIVGPSGCGKSTLLRIAARLMPATAGEVEVEDRPVGYVFQDPTLLPWRSVRGNIELLAELHHLPPDERRRRADEAIALTGLTGFEKHLPRALSGGMRMRTSLARTLTLNPRTLLLDEPFGALDEITRERLNEELLRLHTASRFSALLVTHSVSEAVFTSSRVAIMSARPGRIVEEIEVSFPYPREPALKSDPTFYSVVARVSETLRRVVP